MVPLPQILTSNSHIRTAFPHKPLVAVFVGGTSGVGSYTLIALSKYAPPSSRFYIVGRNEEAAEKIIADCKREARKNDKKEERGEGKEIDYVFIKEDVSLIKNVDEVCRKIKEKEEWVNVLFMSQGSMAFSKTTSESLPLSFSLSTHSRLRFVSNLLPLLRRTPPHTLRRVISVLAATCEGPIDLSNPYCRDFPLMKQRDQIASIQTLLLQEMARRAPDVSFVHTVPGVVKGGIMRDVEYPKGLRGWRLRAMIWVAGLMAPWINTEPGECGERHVWVLSSGRFPPGNGEGVVGVPVNAEEVARGVDGRIGSGVYSVGPTGESAPERVEEVLREFKEDGTAEKVWELVRGDFVRITGREVSV